MCSRGGRAADGAAPGARWSGGRTACARRGAACAWRGGGLRRWQARGLHACETKMPAPGVLQARRLQGHTVWRRLAAFGARSWPMRLCDGVMLAEPGRSGREQSVRVALKVWRYAARRSGPMRGGCEAKRSEPTRGNTVPGGLAKFPRQIGEVPPAARRGPPRLLDEVPPAGRRGPAGGCPAKCVCPALVANGANGSVCERYGHVW